jgi:putative nucleotidyltransferase with HDIG domain/PAS domain S-box-containing protein
VEDITEHKQAEEKLQESEANLKEAQALGRMGNWEFDLDKQTIQWSDQVYRLYERDPALGPPTVEEEAAYYSPEQAERLHEYSRIAAEQGRAYEYDLEARLPSGRIAHFAATMRPFEDGGGRIVKLFGTVQDITERKRAEEQLQKSFQQTKKVLEEVVWALSAIVEKRDPYTAGHQRRVADLACAIAGELNLPEVQIEGIRVAGLIHDIGKMNVPAEILSKTGRLSEAEFSMIKTHAQVGKEILESIDFPWPVAQVVHQHHERLNGTGYPQGLSDGKIILEAKIMAVADVVEAMASHRPYRPALGIEKALEEILNQSGILYDPQVVDACRELFDKKGYKLAQESAS